MSYAKPPDKKDKSPVFRFISILACFGLLASLVLGSASFYVSENLILFGNSTWPAAGKDECNEWVETAVLRPFGLSCAYIATLKPREFRLSGLNHRPLVYRIFSNDQSNLKRPFLVYLNGFKGGPYEGTKYLSTAKALGFDLVILDFYNFGHSGRTRPGSGLGAREADDVVSLFQELSDKFPQTDVYVSANSLGTMAFLNAMPQLSHAQVKNLNIRAVSLENPIPTPATLLLDSPAGPRIPFAVLKLALWLTSLKLHENLGKTDPLSGAAALKLPTFVQYSDDLFISEASTKLLFASLGTSVKHMKRYKGGEHGAAGRNEPQAFVKDLEVFFRTHMRISADVLTSK